jgi:hypothetical protein
MILQEFFNPRDQEDQDKFRNEKEDSTIFKSSDKRKIRLTLRQLNSLRMLSDSRRIEYKKELEQVKKQYGAPPAEAGGGMGM